MDALEKRIIDYCDGTLSTDEVRRFEKEIENDPVLKKKVERQREILLSIQSKEFLELLPSAQLPNKRRGRKNILWIVSTAAAAAIVGIIIINTFTNSDPSLEELFYTDPGLITPMSTVKAYEFYDGMVEYKIGNYTEALNIWDNNLPDIGIDTLHYYQAMAHLNLGQYEQSQELLKGLENSSWSTNAIWYQIYILLRQQRKEEARELYESLSSEAPGYDVIGEYLQ